MTEDSNEAIPATAAARAEDGVITWVQCVPLLTNRFILWDMGKALVITVAIMWVLLAGMGWLVNGEPLLIPWQMLLVILGGMAVLMTLACLLMLNRVTMTLGVGPAGAGYSAGSAERKWNRLAIVAGVLGGSAAATGAGLLATADEQGGWLWSELRRANEHPRQRVISLRNSWRVVLRLYCTPANYEQVRATVSEGLKLGATERAKVAAEAPPRRRRRWYAYAAAVLVPVVGVVLTAAWPWLWYEDGMRVVLLSAALLIAAGLVHGVPRAVAALVSLVPTGWAVYLTVREMFEISPGIMPGTFRSGWQIDTPLMAATLAGEALLLALALWRLFGRDGKAEG